MEKIPILAIEDNEEDLQLIRLILETEGYPVVTAATLKEARSHLAAGAASILLIDIALPDGDGLTILKEAREMDPDAVGIVLTASTRQQDAVRSMLEGAFDYVPKPIDAGLLSAAVRRAVDHFHLSREVRLKDEMLDNGYVAEVAHELRNPLTVVQGYVQMLDNDMSVIQSDAIHGYISSLHENCHRMSLLIEDLLDVERFRKRKLILALEAVAPFDLVESIVGDYENQAKNRRLELKWGVTPGQRPVLADARRIGQVLSNIISNALKFTPAGGSVSVWAWPSGDDFVFCVEDTGPGLSEEDAKHIFERHYQTDSGAANPDGLGFGLSIAKKIVDLHGGRIWVESVPGKGCRIQFTLPTTSAKVDPSRYVVKPITARKAIRNGNRLPVR